MPTVNKVSLKVAVEQQREGLRGFKDRGVIPPEVVAWAEANFALIELVAAAFLEKATPKTSSNSGIPSSKDDKEDDTTKQTGGGSGGKGNGPKDNGDACANTRTNATQENVSVDKCGHCGEDLSQVPPDGHEKRVLVDIIFETVERTVNLERKTCPHCKHETRARAPENMPGPLQYGNGLIAFAVHLLTAHMLSLKRCAQLIRVLTGHRISEATLLNFLRRAYDALEKWEQEAVKRLKAKPTLHVDETSVRVDKKNCWVHVATDGTIVVKHVHQQRGAAAMEEIGIIPDYIGTIVHDCWKSYFTFLQCMHALCGAHLARECVGIQDSNGYRWAYRMERLLVFAARRVKHSPSKRLSDKAYQWVVNQYRKILAEGEEEMPTIPPRQPGQRGPVAKTNAHNLLERFKTHETEILRFAIDPYCPFTNNAAERALRMGKVKQKVSGCFRTFKSTKWYCRNSSFGQTASALGYNPLVAFSMALDGKALETLDGA